jgi:hypothetical protein
MGSGLSPRSVRKMKHTSIAAPPNGRTSQRTTSILRGTLAHFNDFYMPSPPRFSFSRYLFRHRMRFSAYIIPGSPAPTHARELSTFTMAASPASVQTPRASYIGGLGWDMTATLRSPLLSPRSRVQRPSEPVCRRAARRRCDVTRIVFAADPPVALDFGNSPSVEVVSIGVYVMPVVLREPIASVLLDFRWRAPITPAPVILPATLTMTRGGSGAWQKDNWFMGDRQGVGRSAVQSFPFPSTGP